MSLTSDRSDPRLGHGADTEPGPQNEVYLVMPDADRKPPFVRPVRRSYMHVGIAGPQHELRDLTDHEREIYGGKYAKYEPYPESKEHAALGRLWTQADLDKVGKGCGTVTTMGQALAETYAAQPGFYGATYCCGCSMHLPVGAHGEFVWMDKDGNRTEERVGT